MWRQTVAVTISLGKVSPPAAPLCVLNSVEQVHVINRTRATNVYNTGVTGSSVNRQITIQSGVWTNRVGIL